MRTSILLPALVGLAAAQSIDYPAIEKYPDPELVVAPCDEVQDTPPDVPADPITPITTPPSRVKRHLLLQKRDGDCAPQPTGSGPVPSPDTVSAFLSFPTLHVCFVSSLCEPQLMKASLWRTTQLHQMVIRSFSRMGMPQ